MISLLFNHIKLLRECTVARRGCEERGYHVTKPERLDVAMHGFSCCFEAEVFLMCRSSYIRLCIAVGKRLCNARLLAIK